MRFLALVLLAFPLTVNAGIYKCVINGETTYQGQPCPGNAETKEDVSHLKSRTPAYSDNRLKFEQRQYDDYRTDRKQSYEDRQRDRVLRQREIDREKHSRDRERLVRDAQYQNDRARSEKAERDRRWRQEKDKRKARNNGSYRYYDINVN